VSRTVNSLASSTVELSGVELAGATALRIAGLRARHGHSMTAAVHRNTTTGAA
jgi:hypothetical protein